MFAFQSLCDLELRRLQHQLADDDPALAAVQRADKHLALNMVVR